MKKRLPFHILFWLIYYLWSSYVTASFDYKFYRAFMSEAITLPLKIVVAYFLLYYLLPKYILTGKYKKLIIIFFLLALIAGFIFRVLQGAIILPVFYPQRPFTPWDIGRFMWALFEIFSISAILLSIKLFILKFESMQREKELENEKLQTELSFLKAQINPHFLFNTLNNIYGLSLKNSPQTSDSILKLSELLRFILHDGSMSEIKIIDEIKIINDYIELEKLRYGERLNINFKIDIDNQNQMIAPLILLSFIENSFKHGASESRFNSSINISLLLKNGYLTFSVINSKEGGSYNDNGIGLKNIRRQLELIYESRHSINIQNSNDLFELKLTINLLEHANIKLPDR